MDFSAISFDFGKTLVRLSTGPLDCFVAGEGDPVLYLHGRGGLRKSAVHNLVAETFRLYLPVHPGFDGTAFHDGVASMPALAALYADFIETAVGAPCHVIGHSFGGWLAAWLAVDHGDKVRSLVLECPAGFRPGGAPSTTVDVEEVQRLLYAHPERLPPDDRPEGMEDANRLTAPHYHGGMPLDDALTARLGEIRCPALLLFGTEERLIPEETCRILEAGVPDLRLVRIPDAAHALEIDQPERVGKEVLAFLGGDSPTGPVQPS